MFSLLQQTAPVVVEETEAVTTTVPADAAHAAVAGHTAAPGMPQLDVSTYGNLLFWTAIALVVIYWALSRIALPRIQSVLADRQGTITGDLMSAEEFKQKAKDAEAAYDKALAEAREEAQKIVAANRVEIQKELDTAIAHADAEISARSAESEKRIGEIRATALDDARTVAREVTRELVKLFGGQADDAAIEVVVEERLKGTA